MYSLRTLLFQCAVLGAAAFGPGALPHGAEPPRSTLHVISGDSVMEWWRSDRAPTQWTAPLAVVADRFSWGNAATGVDTASAHIHVNRGLIRLLVIAVRLDPAQLELRLVEGTAANRLSGTWTVDSADDDAVFAVNAGQFSETGPWGWLVANGAELRYPGAGPLAMALAVDTGGAVSWLSDEDVLTARGRLPVREAFQSYPLLLERDGRVPRLLRTSPDLDRSHRDTRLAAGRLADGRILFVLTRFTSAGPLLHRLPVGLTTPETAALMGALGARPAVMLDGGLSAQMLVRTSGGRTLSWPGARRVPLALVAFPPH